MCELSDAGCKKTMPEECTPEQIRECHGDVSEHPCIKRGEVMRRDI